MASFGTETWGKDNHEVIKVQMVYNGEIAGRRSPSYPINKDYYDRVDKANGLGFLFFSYIRFNASKIIIKAYAILTANNINSNWFTSFPLIII